MSEEDVAIFDEYIDRFILSDLSLIKITDENYSRNFLRKALQQRIIDRGLINLIAYTILSELFMEKV